MAQAHLSPAQWRMMDEIAEKGQTSTMDLHGLHGLKAGAFSAWHRTAQSLERRGLVKIIRDGGSYRAVRTSGCWHVRGGA